MQTDTGIFALLKTEHAEVKTLFSKAEKSAPGKRKALLAKIETELIPHARGEEKTVYALLLERSSKEGRSDAEELTREAYEEHRVVDRLLLDLKALPENDSEWVAKLKVLKENVVHHIKEEEEELFEKIQSLFSDEECSHLRSAYLEAKERYAETLPTQGRINERSASAEARKAI